MVLASAPSPAGLRLADRMPISTRLSEHRLHTGDESPTALIDTAEDDNEPSVVRHADLWFTDGSVVLRAENTLFRVHMSQLSRHSVFFRDMFTLPQPDGDVGSDKAFSMKIEPEGHVLLIESEGCPVVHLHDTAEDVGNLLTALYDGPSFGDNDPDDFRIVSGILRLSTKYIIDSLRAKAIAHLNIAWPSTLKGWDAREDISRSHDLEGSSQRYPSPIALINLSREVNVPSLLPSAFYDLSRYHFSQIFEPNEDGEFLLRPQSPTVSPVLSPSDMQKLALGKEASQYAITSLIQAMGNSPQYHYSQQHHTTHTSPAQFRKSTGRTCVSAAACRKDFSELVDLATQHYLFDRERGCLDPLYVAEELGQLKSAEFSECKACAKSLESWAAKERERIWKLIPLWFRLESQYGL